MKGEAEVRARHRNYAKVIRSLGDNPYVRVFIAALLSQGSFLSQGPRLYFLIISGFLGMTALAVRWIGD